MNIIIRGMVLKNKQKYSTLGDVIDAIEAEKGEIIDIIADGQKITNFTAEEIEGIKPIIQLEVIAKEANTLGKDTLSEITEFIPRFTVGIEEVIDKFAQGKDSDGFKMLEQALESLQWLNTLVFSLESKFQGLKEIDEREFVVFKSNWIESIKELYSAFAGQDLVLTSDILEYELIPTLNKFLKLIEKLNEENK